MSDLAALLMEQAILIKAAGTSIHGLQSLGYSPTPLMLQDAESAASRVIRAVEAYRLSQVLNDPLPATDSVQS